MYLVVVVVVVVAAAAVVIVVLFAIFQLLRNESLHITGRYTVSNLEQIW